LPSSARCGSCRESVVVYCPRLRSAPTTKTSPEALRLGFNDDLEKRLDFARLCTTITRLIRANRIAATEKVD
jgi:hypothetical protein